MEFVFEAAEGSLALDGPGEPLPGLPAGDRLGEVGHVLVPDPGRQRVDGSEVRSEFVEVDQIVAVDSGVGRPERDVSAARIDQPPVLIAFLVSQCLGDLLQVEAMQFQHVTEHRRRCAIAGVAKPVTTFRYQASGIERCPGRPADRAVGARVCSSGEMTVILRPRAVCDGSEAPGRAMACRIGRASSSGIRWSMTFIWTPPHQPGVMTGARAGCSWRQASPSSLSITHSAALSPPRTWRVR